MIILQLRNQKNEGSKGEKIFKLVNCLFKMRNDNKRNGEFGK